MRGWVYIITNKAMPGLIKIGYTLKDPELRAQELSNTGNPHPYQVDYEVFVVNPYSIEKKIHQELSDSKEGKEWFRCSTTEGINCIRAIIGNSGNMESVKCQDVASYRPFCPTCQKYFDIPLCETCGYPRNPYKKVTALRKTNSVKHHDTRTQRRFCPACQGFFNGSKCTCGYT